MAKTQSRYFLCDIKQLCIFYDFNTYYCWTFCMFFKAASNFNYDFLKLLRKLSCENIFLLYWTFIKLLLRFIKVLAATLGREVLQVSLRISSNFNCSWDDNNFAVILVQNIFQFNCGIEKTRCNPAKFTTGLSVNFPGFMKITLRAGLQHEKNPSSLN